MPEAEQFHRLPATVLPKHYKLMLQPNLIKCTFKGSVEVEIEVKEPVDNIILNCVDLDIKEAIILQSNKEIISSSYEFISSAEILKINFSETLDSVDSVLKINFEGVLNDKLKGFYRNKYFVGSEERYASVTQFEATDARRCFPCWDEPAIKATFDIMLIAPKNRIALSNMQEISRETHPSDVHLDIVKFATTPIMSTYLVAIVVGEYDYIEQKLDNGVEVKVYTPLGKKEQGLFALEVASKVLLYYEDYFLINYPLPKLDLIAIADFSVGAMENWGLITYRETCLLVDPHNTSASQKQSIAITVGHEIAHQWFGNLVTMEWWTHLWLNEGYATFCEFLCIDDLFPHYDIWTQFLTSTYICALELDALKNSHPIEVPIGHPSEVDEIFDNISYCKGACVIRMIHSYVGEKSFRKGMNTYLNRHKFDNAKTEDLWKALEEASGKPVDSIMSTWTKKTGFPLVSVASQQDGDNRILTLTQQKFFADGTTDNSTLWMIPVNIITADSETKPVKEFLLDTESCQVILEDVPSNSWVKLNMGTIGYYRIKYTTQMMSQLLPAITSKLLSPLDRLGILDDLFALVQAGHCSSVEILQLLQAFEGETDYTVWTAVCNCLSQLNKLLSHTSYYSYFTVYARKLLSKIGIKVGWDAKPGENHLEALLRMLILDRLGMYGEESVIEEAKKRLSAHLAGSAVIPADLRSPIYKSVLSQNCSSTFEQMIKLYKETELCEEKDRISVSLGSAKDSNLIQRTLQFAMSSDVRNQDTIFVVIGVSQTAPGRRAAWNFFKENIKEFRDRFEGSPLIGRLIKGITDNFASEEMASEVCSFFQKTKPIESTERAIQQSIECIKLNAAWLTRDTEAIEKFLIAEL